MFLGIFGGWVSGVLSGLFSGADYIVGIQTDFNPFLLFYEPFFLFKITAPIAEQF